MEDSRRLPGRPGLTGALIAVIVDILVVIVVTALILLFVYQYWTDFERILYESLVVSYPSDSPPDAQATLADFVYLVAIGLLATIIPSALSGLVLGRLIARRIASGRCTKRKAGWLGLGIAMATLVVCALIVNLGIAPWRWSGWLAQTLIGLLAFTAVCAPVVAPSGYCVGRLIWWRLARYGADDAIVTPMPLPD